MNQRTILTVFLGLSLCFCIALYVTYQGPDAIRSGVSVGDQLNHQADASESSSRVQLPPLPSSLVTWRPREETTSRVQRPPKPYEELVADARDGSRQAIEILAATLEFCRRRGPPPMLDAEFQKSIDRLYNERRMTVYVYGEEQFLDVDYRKIESSLKMMTMFRDRCNGIPMNVRIQADDWNSRLAQASALNTPQQIEADTIAAESLWKSGDPRALISLATVYERAFNNGMAEDGEIRSVGYLVAFQMLLLDAERFATPLQRRAYATTRQWLDQQIVRTSEDEREQAMILAVNVLKESESCCVYPF